MQTVVLLDLEGVLLPEMWKQIASQTGVEQLGLTTRDISNYDELMTLRIRALHEHKITIDAIHGIISQMAPLPGALDFFLALRKNHESIIVSDTFVEFFTHFREILHFPVIFCNTLNIDSSGMIQHHILRQKRGKYQITRNLQAANFNVLAVGDSYNDIEMLTAADYGVLFCPPEYIVREYPQLPVFTDYTALKDALLQRQYR